MSPLVWDLAHIAAYEDLWLVHRHGGGELLQPELAAMYDAFETPRAVRGDLPLLDRAQALAYLAEVRERALRVLDERGTGDGELLELVLRHEQQHDETMLQAIELARLLAAPALEPDAAAARAGGHSGLESVEVPGRARARIGAPAGSASPTTTSARATAPSSRAFRIGRTPITNAHLPDASPRAAATSAASGGATRAGPGRRTTTSPTQAAGPAARPAGGSGGSTDGRRCTPTSPWSTCPGSRPMPSPAHTAHASRRRRSGRRRRPGTRRADGPPLPVGRRAARAARRANLDQAGLGPHPAGAYPDGAAPCGALGMLGDVWEWTASDFRGYDGFAAHPYREYSEVFFGPDYKVLRGGSWATRARVRPPPRCATGTSRSGARSSRE